MPAATRTVAAAGMRHTRLPLATVSTPGTGLLRDFRKKCRMHQRLIQRQRMSGETIVHYAMLDAQANARGLLRMRPGEASDDLKSPRGGRAPIGDG